MNSNGFDKNETDGGASCTGTDPRSAQLAPAHNDNDIPSATADTDESANSPGRRHPWSATNLHHSNQFMNVGQERPPFPHSQLNMNMYQHNINGTVSGLRPFGATNHGMPLAHPNHQQMNFPQPAMPMYPFASRQMMVAGGPNFQAVNAPYGGSFMQSPPQYGQVQHQHQHHCYHHHHHYQQHGPSLYPTSTSAHSGPNVPKNPSTYNMTNVKFHSKNRKGINNLQYRVQSFGPDGRSTRNASQTWPPIGDETRAKHEAIKEAARKAALLPSRKERLAIMTAGATSATNHQCRNKQENREAYYYSKKNPQHENVPDMPPLSNAILPTLRHAPDVAATSECRNKCALYDTTTFKVTKEQIRKAMPKDASAIFHILNRRINFDAHQEDASMYSLIRSWVQDDPFRYTPPAGSNLLEYISLPSQRRVEFLDERDEEDYDEEEMIDILTQLPKGPGRGPVDVFAKLKNIQQEPSIETLRASQVIQGEKRRVQEKKFFKKCRRKTIRNLKRLGIDIVAIGASKAKSKGS